MKMEEKKWPKLRICKIWKAFFSFVFCSWLNLQSINLKTTDGTVDLELEDEDVKSKERQKRKERPHIKESEGVDPGLTAALLHKSQTHSETRISCRTAWSHKCLCASQVENITKQNY